MCNGLLIWYIKLQLIFNTKLLSIQLMFPITNTSKQFDKINSITVNNNQLFDNFFRKLIKSFKNVDYFISGYISLTPKYCVIFNHIFIISKY